jgi:hypothetical protein
MTRTHRSVHRVLWPILAVLVALGFVMAIIKRAPPPPQTSVAISGSAR